MVGDSYWINNGMDWNGTGWCIALYVCGVVSAYNVIGRVCCFTQGIEDFGAEKVANWWRAKRDNNNSESSGANICGGFILINFTVDKTYIIITRKQ